MPKMIDLNLQLPYSKIKYACVMMYLKKMKPYHIFLILGNPIYNLISYNFFCTTIHLTPFICDK